MKAMLQLIVAAACAATLVACGGGDKTPQAVVVAQPDYKLTETAVGTGSVVAAAGDTVTFKYNGYLYNANNAANGYRGDKVRSTYDSNTTFTYTVGVGAGAFTAGIGPGWDMALLGMRAGGTRTAILPANLAYGATSYEAVTANGITYSPIPANSPMVFDFEMVSVTKAVVVTPVPAPTTLVIKDTTTGTGDTAAAGKTLTVTYSLYLYDGGSVTLRSALKETNSNFSFVLGNGAVIKGWDQGLVGMKVGGTRTLTIPPDLAYGAAGQGSIPGNSTLVFDIALTAVK
ncbi:FKBP-type peptidylprolyl isomerase [Duganella sp. FT94W]|uniref:Peptidyl-prolyl cis-trans isomerase n=1 Tax=Duganella lactea TaxID=2692173 RepID=A0ABW9V3D6_9BURK|nr:FKBP-type peptidyl-prolyl cis-trans isomerase [Duganella lactea]MYM33072.1 FKBP-type peptidylprolyl isomerase [Duganella lactea]